MPDTATCEGRDLPSPEHMAQALSPRSRQMLMALPDRVHELPFEWQVMMASSRGTAWRFVTAPPHGWAVRRDPWTLSEWGRKMQAEIRRLEAIGR